MSHNETPRILGLDILKFLTLLAICILHVNEFIFFTNDFPLGNRAPIWNLFSYYARIFALGGQVLVGIIFFLFGIKKKKRAFFLKISLFCLFGQLILYFTFNTLEWDIYSYLFTSSILLGVIKYFQKFNLKLIIFCITILFLPNNIYLSFFSANNIMSLLVGTYSKSSSGPWPLLPWFFLALLFYQLGLKVKENKNSLDKWQSFETPLHFGMLLLSLPFLGFYYNLPIGPNFYHFAFYQNPIIFFSNFYPFLLFARLSFLIKAQHYLENNKMVLFISKLYWNKYLGVTYLISIIYLAIGMKYRQSFLNSPWLFDLYFLGLMPVSEIFSRIIIKTKSKLGKP